MEGCIRSTRRSSGSLPSNGEVPALSNRGKGPGTLRGLHGVWCSFLSAARWATKRFCRSAAGLRGHGQSAASLEREPPLRGSGLLLLGVGRSRDESGNAGIDDLVEAIARGDRIDLLNPTLRKRRHVIALADVAGV